MPTPTYDLIASSVLSSATTSVSLSPISGSYRDLVLVVQPSGDTDFASFNMRFNSDSGTSYSYVNMLGGDSFTSSASDTSQTSIPSVGASSTDRPLHIINIMDYSATNKHKTIIMRSNRAGVQVRAQAARWASTSAITSIEVFSGNAMKTGSSFYLYAIAS